jgi:hypothetical protein
MKKNITLTLDNELIEKFRDNYVGSLSSFVEGNMSHYLKLKNIEIED